MYRKVSKIIQCTFHVQKMYLEDLYPHDVRKMYELRAVADRIDRSAQQRVYMRR